MVPLLRCSTVPTLPLLLPSSSGCAVAVSPSNTSLSLSSRNNNDNNTSIYRCPSQRSSRDLSLNWHPTSKSSSSNNKQHSFLSVWVDDNEEQHHGGRLSIGSGSKLDRLIECHLKMIARHQNASMFKNSAKFKKGGNSLYLRISTLLAGIRSLNFIRFKLSKFLSL